MNGKLYLKLAWSGIRKNRQLYLPYMLTCVCVVMMYYILASLVYSEALNGTYGGRTVTATLALGRIVIAVFAVIFLFYTHSFLIRRRSREFGLYNILGMNKRDIARILLRESLMVFAMTLAGGLALGILFSKLSELLLLRIVRLPVGFTLTVSGKGISETATLFAAIFFLILLSCLLRVHLSSPLSLLKSENVGEKPPKANYVLAILGALLLGAAYFIAVRIQNPVDAITLFFFAVILVILATYLLFVSGSVTLCRVLQKNRNYYYKANHFVSTSSMAYRMKRNGAGLASICILSTMVLVMLSTTVCLFVGIEDTLKRQYPTDLSGTITIFDEEDFREDYFLACKENLNGAVLGCAKEQTALRMIETYGAYMPDGTFLSQSEAPNTSHIFGNTLETSTLLVLIPLADYNEAAGENVLLSDDEALIQVWKEGKPEPAADAPERFACSGGKELRNAGAPDMQALHLFVETTGGTVIAVMNDPAAYMHDLAENYDYVYYRFYFAVDLTDEGKAFYDAADGEETRFGFVGRLRDNIPQDVDLGYTSVSRSEMRASLYALYGGLFFLGIMLSFIFLIAAVLIIYYKQVCEGFEDAARFDVMRKVGMTRREIRRAIDSQVLTVFFAPLVMAGLHIAFAFPMIRHILMLFDVTDLALLVPVYIGSFVLFALFYALIYRRTAKTYLSIVSPAEG